MGQIGREIQTAAMAKMFIAWKCMKRKKSSGFCRNGEAQRPAQFPRFSRYSFRVFGQKLLLPKHSYCLFGLGFKHFCRTGEAQWPAQFPRFSIFSFQVFGQKLLCIDKQKLLAEALINI